jgi:hypothetical protein
MKENTSPATSPALESQVKAKHSARSTASRSVAGSTKSGKKAVGGSQRKYSGLPQRCWKGTRLWKIPYSGVGLAEERKVRIKHAPAAPGPHVKVIEVLQEEGVESKKGYMAFPPTLQWSNPDKADDRSNSRQLILSKDDQVTEGYSSVAFLKGKRKGE